eukprot:232139-Karenia_brevis.AAC.1
MAMTSYRGIRLISRFASWFGQILDNRLRHLWTASAEQFGFQHGRGCSEAIFVLLTLIHSRLAQGKRLDEMHSITGHLQAIARNL